MLILLSYIERGLTVSLLWQNHLDLHAVLWLESYLVKWPKTFIVVSHAREFLNTVPFYSRGRSLWKIIVIGQCNALFCYSYIIELFYNYLKLFFQVVTDVLHLQGQKLTAYKGDYDTFERTREEQAKNQQKAFESNERVREHMQVCIFSPLLHASHA